MLTAGVDLATEASKTALAVLEWTAGGARLVDLSLGVSDETIVSTATTATSVGIDCPFGWPDDFVHFLTAHRRDELTAPTDLAGKQWRQRLAYRTTDRAVQHDLGLRPLSVAADRISLTAMRCAELLAKLANADIPVDRSGRGAVVEVYPAASLKRWGLRHQGYKGADNQHQQQTLVASLLSNAPWLHLGPHEALCAKSDDAFDAVIASITSRAHALRLTTTPENGDQQARAEREGWIAVPTCSMDELLTRGASASR